MAEALSDNRGPVIATIATSADGWFRAVSPRFLAMVGGSVEALAGVNAVDLVHPMQTSAVRQVLASAKTIDEQVVATQLFLGDTWSPVEIVIERMVDERSTWRLYRPAEASAPSLTAPADEAAAAAPAIEPAANVDGPTPPAAAALPDFVSLTSPALLSSESSGDFLQEGSNADTAYATLMPPDSVSGQRGAVRRSVGDDSIPMLEIDVDGRTTFVRGRWGELSSEGGSGADVFEELLEKSGKADPILAAIGNVFETAAPSNHEISVPDVSPRWVRVMPIPSPHLAGVVHALVAVVDESAIEAATHVAVDAPSRHDIRGDTLAGTAGASIASQPTDTAVAPHDDSPSPSPGERPDATGSRKSNVRRLSVFAGLAILAGVVILVIASLASDESAQLEPVSLNLTETEAVQVTDEQTWQAIGAESLGELQAIATTSDGGFVAEVNGRLIRLDAQGAAVEVISVRGGEATFVTDIDTDESGVVWVLDAGIGVLSRVAPDGTVTVVTADPALLNARGVGAGLENTLFVASTASAQLIEIGVDGQFVRMIALPGRQPSDVAQADDGTLWMVDAEQLELVHLTEDGELLSAFALESFSSLQSPHIAIAGGVPWVTEPESSAIFAVDTETGQPTGERIELARPDGTQVNKPIGVAATASGQLWIADSNGGAIILVTNATF